MAVETGVTEPKTALDPKAEICLVARFFDLRNGGIGRFSMEMREGLEKRGYHIQPVSAGRQGDNGYLIYSAFDLLRRLPRKCDVYHCMTPVETLYAPKARTIVTFHDLVPWLHLTETETHYAQGQFKQAKRFISKNYFHFASRIASHCRFVVCNSDQTKSEVIEHLGVDEKKVSVVRLGVARGLEPRARQDRVFRVGTLSYLDRRKRIDLLIKAFLEANVDGELVIGGTGVDGERLRAAAGGDPRIKFAGFVAEEKMVDFYNSLDLFVFPTRFEGYGMPMVEAFFCKKPVVVLNDGVMPDEIKSRCLVTDNLVEFLKKPQKAAQRDIEANYRFARLHDWDKCVEEYVALYQKVIQGNSKS